MKMLKTYGVVRSGQLQIFNATEEEIRSGQFTNIPIFQEAAIEGKTEDEIQRLIIESEQ